MSVLGRVAGSVVSRCGGNASYGAAALVALLSLACPAAAWSEDWAPILAWGLTFGPGAVVMLLALRFRDARQAVSFVLLSTAFRLAAAGGGALLVIKMLPEIHRDPFLLWLGVMYLLALGVEVYLTLTVTSAWAKLGSLSAGGPAGPGLQEARR